METQNLTPKPRGNPNWKKKAGKTEEAAGIPVQDDKLDRVPENTQSTTMEAEVIEQGIDYDSLMASSSTSEIVGRIAKKYKGKKYIALVNREDAARHGQAWQYLKLCAGKEDVDVVKSIDEATKTHWNVLCWRDQRIQDVVDKMNNDRLRISNELGKPQSDRHHINQLNHELKSISPGIGVREIRDSDTDF